MTVIDLTHIITPTMPVYPGTLPPKLEPATTIADDGFRETLLTLFSHTGTHMDAPAHIFEDMATLDVMEAAAFVGPAVVVDVSHLGAGETIPPEVLNGTQNVDYVLFYTGWNRFWGSADYFSPFPVPAAATVERLLSLGVKGMGVDAISIDPMDSLTLPNHQILLGAGLVNLENLTGLEALVGKEFILCALPLKFEGSDGAPIRAIALL